MWIWLRLKPLCECDNHTQKHEVFYSFYWRPHLQIWLLQIGAFEKGRLTNREPTGFLFDSIELPATPIGELNKQIHFCNILWCLTFKVNKLNLFKIGSYGAAANVEKYSLPLAHNKTRCSPEEEMTAMQWLAARLAAGWTPVGPACPPRTTATTVCCPA